MAYANLTDLENRVEEALDEDQQRIALSALEDLSIEAAHYGRQWPDEQCPPIVKMFVLRAVARWLPNALGLVQSRAGDETLVFTDLKERAGAPSFTQYEIDQIRNVANPDRGGIVSVPIFAMPPGPAVNRPRTHEEMAELGYVYPFDSGDPIPYFQPCGDLR